MKRAFLFAVCFALLFASVSSLASAAVIDVCTAQDLWNVRNDLTASYRQTCDIDLSGMNWVPLGGAFTHFQAPVGNEAPVFAPNDGPFRGTYDGNHKIITGLRFTNDTGFIQSCAYPYYDSTCYGKVYGLFGFSSGTIKNVRLHDVLANSLQQGTVGSLVGVNFDAQRYRVTNNSRSFEVSLSQGSVEGSFVSSIMNLGPIYFAGGIVGDNRGKISDSSSLVFVTREGDHPDGVVDYSEYRTSLDKGSVGGLAGGSSGTISSSSANVSISGHFSNAGGVAGSTYKRGPSLFDLQAIIPSIPFTGSSYFINDLLFYERQNSAPLLDHLRASVVITRPSVGGGLVGSATGTIRDSSSEGVITSIAYSSPPYPGCQRNCYWTVVGTPFLGGLVGSSTALIERSRSLVSLDAGQSGGRAGGLVGSATGTIRDSSASGTVRASGAAGGLVAEAWAGFDSSYRPFFTVIDNSSASGLVSAGRNAGGLVGNAFGGVWIMRSSATGSVNWSGESQTGWRDCVSGDCFGGLVGQSRGALIESSYATGSVSGRYSIGGLVGRFYHQGPMMVPPALASRAYQPLVFNSYAIGAVSGAGVNVGGLVGSVWRGSNSDACEIRNSHARGVVAGDRVGGLVGGNEGSLYCDIISSYWDMDASHQPSSFGGTGLTSAQMAQFSSFVGWDPSVWSVGSEAYPRFASLAAPPADSLPPSFNLKYTFDSVSNGMTYDTSSSVPARVSGATSGIGMFNEGQGLRFDGASYVSFDRPILFTNTSALMAWVALYRDAPAGAVQTVFSNGVRGSAQPSITLYIDAARRPVARVYSANSLGAFVEVSGAPLALHQWYSLGVYQTTRPFSPNFGAATGLSLIVNGIEVNTTALPAAPYASPNWMLVGAQNDAQNHLSDFLYGSVDEVILYNLDAQSGGSDQFAYKNSLHSYVSSLASSTLTRLGLSDAEHYYPLAERSELVTSADPELMVLLDHSSSHHNGRCFTSLRRFSTNLTSLGSGCPSTSGPARKSPVAQTVDFVSSFTFEGASSNDRDSRVNFFEVPGFTPSSAVSVSTWFNSRDAFGTGRRFELVNIDQRLVIRNDERSVFGSSLTCIWYVGGNGAQWDYLSSRMVPASAIRTNVWNHVACVHDGHSAKLYLNGELIASSNARAIGWNEPLPGFAPLHEISIGASKFDLGRGYSVNPFKGAMSDVRVYGRALSDSDVAFLARFT